MIHRYLYDALKIGIAQLTSTPEYLDDIFTRSYGLEASEVAAIKTYFAAHPPTVVNGYARVDVQFPAIAIVLGRESESDKYLGESAGVVTDEEDDLFNADITGAIWQFVYNLEIYAENPDVVTWYYEIAKQIIQDARDFFIDRGVFEIQLSGSDMAPDPAYMPEHLFGRQLTVECKREMEIIHRHTIAGKAFEVAGVHIDSSGSPSDPGGETLSLVTTYTEGDS
jgi:hypothetical protein